MVLVKNPLGGEFYMDGSLDEDLSNQKIKVNEQDEDRFFVVDGKEGSGKSVLAMQLAAKVDDSFCLDRVVFKPDDFKKAIKKAKKGQAIVFDEAFRGLSRRASLSRLNKLLIETVMECRQKNLFVFIVLPTIFLLESYVAIFRAKGLFHVYRKEGKRGFWIYFNEKKKVKLYLNGKQDYSYEGKNIPRTRFRGRFLNQYVVDEQKYRQKKKDALENSEEDVSEEDNKFMLERDLLLCILKDSLGLSGVVLSAFLNQKGLKLSPRAILYAVKRVKSGKKCED